MHPVERAYRDYGDIVLRRARCLMGNDADAREVVQDVFCRWWARPKLFAGRARVSTWLYVVTTRECVRRLQRGQRRRDLLNEASDLVAPELCGLDAEARVRLRELTCVLSEFEAEALVLHCIDGMTQAEIAHVLGKTRRRVGQILTAAKARAAAFESKSPERASSETTSSTACSLELSHAHITAIKES